MQSRMPQPVRVLPDALKALQSLHEAIQQAGLPPKLESLVHLRASQLNGCATCLHAQPAMAKKVGETEERLMVVAAWRDAPFFTPPERAALALTEAVTRLGEDGVSDAVWEDAARHFDQPQLAALLLSISTINVWNRLNVATRQVAGANKW